MQPSARSIQPIAGAPKITAASSESIREITVTDESGDARVIYIPGERPLTVLLDGGELVTLMTLGGAPELLVLGFLINQRLIASAADIESIAVDWESAAATVKIRAPRPERSGPLLRAGASGQGSVFTRLMAHADNIRVPGVHDVRIRRESLLQMLDIMRQHDTIHKLARSVHSCALFQGGHLFASVEDVSRHNALDIICGWMALHGIKGADSVLFSTGRLTGEIIIKAAQFGVPIMVSRNGVSAMAHDLAKKFGMTLIGRAVNRRYLCYAGAERLHIG